MGGKAFRWNPYSLCQTTSDLQLFDFILDFVLRAVCGVAVNIFEQMSDGIRKGLLGTLI